MERDLGTCPSKKKNGKKISVSMIFALMAPHIDWEGLQGALWLSPLTPCTTQVTELSKSISAAGP